MDAELIKEYRGIIERLWPEVLRGNPVKLFLEHGEEEAIKSIIQQMEKRDKIEVKVTDGIGSMGIMRVEKGNGMPRREK